MKIMIKLTAVVQYATHECDDNFVIVVLMLALIVIALLKQCGSDSNRGDGDSDVTVVLVEFWEISEILHELSVIIMAL